MLVINSNLGINIYNFEKCPCNKYNTTSILYFYQIIFRNKCFNNWNQHFGTYHNDKMTISFFENGASVNGFMKCTS